MASRPHAVLLRGGDANEFKAVVLAALPSGKSANARTVRRTVLLIVISAAQPHETAERIGVDIYLHERRCQGDFFGRKGRGNLLNLFPQLVVWESV